MVLRQASASSALRQAFPNYCVHTHLALLECLPSKSPLSSPNPFFLPVRLWVQPQGSLKQTPSQCFILSFHLGGTCPSALYCLPLLCRVCSPNSWGMPLPLLCHRNVPREPADVPSLSPETSPQMLPHNPQVRAPDIRIGPEHPKGRSAQIQLANAALRSDMAPALHWGEKENTFPSHGGWTKNGFRLSYTRRSRKESNLALYIKNL